MGFVFTVRVIILLVLLHFRYATRLSPQEHLIGRVHNFHALITLCRLLSLTLNVIRIPLRDQQQ